MLTLEEFRATRERQSIAEAATLHDLDLDLFDFTVEAFIVYGDGSHYLLETDQDGIFHLPPLREYDDVPSEQSSGYLDDMEEIIYLKSYQPQAEAEITIKHQTIDLTPTWKAMAPAIAAILSDGSEKGRAEIMPELQKMAELADQRNEFAKRIREAADMLSSALMAYEADVDHLTKDDWADSVRDALADLNGGN